MSGRNSRAHAAFSTKRFRQVFDVATDGGTGALSCRGQAVPATWLITGGFIDIHEVFAGAGTTYLLGIAAVGNWNGLGNTNNLCCGAVGAAEALANFWDSAIPRGFSAAETVHGRDKTVLQVGASDALALLTIANTATTGQFTVYFDAIPPDGYAGGAI